MKYAGWVVATIIGGFVTLIIFASMAIFGWGAFQRATADYRGETSVIEKTKANGEFRIQAYEHFYDLCAAVQTIDTTLDASVAELAAAASESDKNRIHTNITGLTAERARGINQYNADARKSGTQGQFRASDLPYQLSTDSHQKGQITSCDA